MADYSYRIYAAASNTAPNFTSIDLAVIDAVANDRTGSGVNGRVAASSTLYFKIDGFVASNGDTLQTIDTTTNSNAAIIVEPFSNAWNATPRAIGATTSFDGLDFDSSGQIIVSTLNTTLRNLVLRGSYAAAADGPFKFAPTAEPSGVVAESCLFIATGASTDSRMVRVLYDVIIRNSVILHTGAAGTNNIFSFGSAGSLAATLEQCTIVSINGGASSVGIQQTSGTLVLKNSYSGGTATPFGGASFATGTIGNAGSSSDTPASGLTNVALSTTNFENVTGGTEDLRVKSTSSLATTGATRLASALTDIFNVSRQDPTTIGAFEALGGGAFSITADQGSYALTGQTAGLLLNRTVSAAQGSYALTGQDATLTKATPGAFVLTVDAGQYVWTGEAALADYAMNAGSGSYALSGQDVTFTIGVPAAYSIVANAGSYTFNGQNARLDWSNEVVTTNGNYTISMSMKIGI